MEEKLMSVTTFEAIVENGQIKLLNAFRLPEKTRVYVVVPSLEIQPAHFVGSPRLAHPEQAIDFVKEVIEEQNDASIRE
jgi:hypothetical protein